MTSTSPPAGSVVRITDVKGMDSWQGSGILLSPDEVLTAAHMIYDPAWGTASDIVVTPDYSPAGQPFGSARGTVTHYFPLNNWNDQISYWDSEQDFAIIHLDHPIANAPTMGTMANFPGGPAFVSGYPGSAQGVLTTDGNTLTQDGFFTIYHGSNAGTSIGPGSSGGPAWIWQNGQAYVVGVVSSESTTGTVNYAEITPTIYNDIKRWVAQDDAVHVTSTPGAVVAQFNADGTITTDQDGAELARLYMAAFGRKPDQGGFSFWTQNYKAAVPQGHRASPDANGFDAVALDPLGDGNSVAWDFTHAQEFTQKYGTLSDSAFVSQIYQNVLHRAPDSAGLSYWVNQLEDSFPMSREQVLVGFADSAENVANTSVWLKIAPA